MKSTEAFLFNGISSMEPETCILKRIGFVFNLGWMLQLYLVFIVHFSIETLSSRRDYPYSFFPLYDRQ